ncbi:4-oxalocrotonate tautomerase [Variovorax sp. PCZ-1]|uniref:4-oxalocrotonate tautomerase n=1 Tax=Variovorax sp. PCZ-1 TaxID=2835533 RepID=UPI0024BDE12F|nr:4-oxalocrotonate tautomerase [Variovorax sp. PCZ-1]
MSYLREIIHHIPIHSPHPKRTNPMPTLKVEMMEGRTPEQKTALVKALTQAVVDSLGSKPESVDILIYDIPRQNWATGGIQWSERQ